MIYLLYTYIITKLKRTKEFDIEKNNIDTHNTKIEIKNGFTF